jgi:hypothetical protein
MINLIPYPIILNPIYFCTGPGDRRSLVADGRFKMARGVGHRLPKSEAFGEVSSKTFLRTCRTGQILNAGGDFISPRRPPPLIDCAEGTTERYAYYG